MSSTFERTTAMVVDNPLARSGDGTVENVRAVAAELLASQRVKARPNGDCRDSVRALQEWMRGFEVQASQPTSGGWKMTIKEVGLKLDAPVQCDCCRQRFMDQKALKLHKKFIYDPNRADSKLEE